MPYEEAPGRITGRFVSGDADARSTKHFGVSEGCVWLDPEGSLWSAQVCPIEATINGECLT